MKAQFAKFTWTLSFAFILIFLLMAFPASNTNNNRVLQVSDQRNILDGAIKQIFSSNRPSPRSQTIPLESERVASLSSLPNEVFDKPYANVSTTANFPFVYPVMGTRKSSGYGYRVHPIRGYSSNHKGLDLAAPVGASIRAMAKGRVIFADPYAGYGKLIVIDHGQGVTTHYAHCDRLTAHIGQLVETGQVIAEVGSTGSSTGPHLHLEVRVKGEPMNPEFYFDGLVAKAEG
jgi:murein DD-endopeptidase MepM/ murein hydrolase activator NlpD